MLYRMGEQDGEFGAGREWLEEQAVGNLQRKVFEERGGARGGGGGGGVMQR